MSCRGLLSLTSSADRSSKKHSFVFGAISIVCADTLLMNWDERRVMRSAIVTYKCGIRHDEDEERR